MGRNHEPSMGTAITGIMLIILVSFFARIGWGVGTLFIYLFTP